MTRASVGRPAAPSARQAKRSATEVQPASMDILLLAKPRETASSPSAFSEAGGDGAALLELQDSLLALRRALHAVLLVSSHADRLSGPPVCPAAPPACPLPGALPSGGDLLLLAPPNHAAQASRSTSKEARQWLFSSIAELELTDPATKRSRFDQFMPGGPACRGKEHEPLALGLLQLLAEADPAEVGAAAKWVCPGLARPGRRTGWLCRLCTMGRVPEVLLTRLRLLA